MALASQYAKDLYERWVRSSYARHRSGTHGEFNRTHQSQSKPAAGREQLPSGESKHLSFPHPTRTGSTSPSCARKCFQPDCTRTVHFSKDRQNTPEKPSEKIKRAIHVRYHPFRTSF